MNDVDADLARLLNHPADRQRVMEVVNSQPTIHHIIGRDGLHLAAIELLKAGIEINQLADALRSTLRVMEITGASPVDAAMWTASLINVGLSEPTQIAMLPAIAERTVRLRPPSLVLDPPTYDYFDYTTADLQPRHPDRRRPWWSRRRRRANG